eukprot:CAMPEP_0202712558 /NCGR_PEP_ID=MMETSP1385-20130828/42891_1 /ASSEMBLY_ACC=CAM_ASM_000861 /TAXON_ID=933848 /ORGANISM="Elphidium margaritaceum" /LENGTH=245 /DNA_ID=CAMNT_0049372633 /DNA_START=31 /DNA_END=768 /DNA_ORIENTATION=-
MVDIAVLIDDAITLVEANTILAGVIGLVSVCLCILLCLCLCMRCSRGGNSNGNETKKPKKQKKAGKGPIKRGAGAGGGAAAFDRPRVFSSHAASDDGRLTPDQILARQTQQQIHNEDKQGLINSEDRMKPNYDLNTFEQLDPQPIAKPVQKDDPNKVDYGFLMQKQDEYNHGNNASNVSANNQQNNYGQASNIMQNNFGQNMSDDAPPPPPPQQQQQSNWNAQPFGVPNYQNDEPFVYKGLGFNG